MPEPISDVDLAFVRGVLTEWIDQRILARLDAVTADRDRLRSLLMEAWSSNPCP